MLAGATVREKRNWPTLIAAEVKRRSSSHVMHIGLLEKTVTVVKTSSRAVT